MLQENARIFLDKSGLKQKIIAEQINVKPNVFTKWITEQVTLTSKQMDRLDTFISEFYKNNAYVNK